MDRSPSEQQELLLLKACKDNHGTLTMELARSLYSSNNSAKSAVRKLEALDYIERKGVGAFKVVQVTTDVEDSVRENKRKESNEKSSEEEVEKKKQEDKYAVNTV